MILHIKISLSNCSLFYDTPHLIHEKTMSCIWLSQSSYWLWELTGFETEDCIESKLPKLKKKSFCLCSIQFSIQRSNIFLSSSASAGEISPYKSMNLEKNYFLLTIWLLWHGPSLLPFTQVLEGLMYITKFMADHVEIINFAFLSRYFEHFSTLLKMYWMMVKWKEHLDTYHTNNNQTFNVLEVIQSRKKLKYLANSWNLSNCLYFRGEDVCPMILIINLIEIVKFKCLESSSLIHDGLNGEVEVSVGPPAELDPCPRHSDDQPPPFLLH